MEQTENIGTQDDQIELREVRLKYGYTQANLAKRLQNTVTTLCISRALISNFERGLLPSKMMIRLKVVLKKWMKNEEKKKDQAISENRNKCMLCDDTFHNKHMLNMHMGIHKMGRHICPICKQRFEKKSNLNTHVRRKHKDEVLAIKKEANRDENETTFPCEICGKTFYKEFNMKRHSKIHTEGYPFKCDNCGKTFKLKRYLRTHLSDTTCKYTEIEENYKTSTT